ncbi:MAG: folate-binding protein [Roseovarius sp.]|nr:folate-binding protein [Roseovarius sp.]MCY4208999.1 folate-binding protein [Roseovarius sp.]
MPRRILRITGSDAERFLQGLITNDINRLQNGMLYAAMLTPQGKYMADFFLLRDNGAILLDVAENIADMLASRMKIYKLRADVNVENSDLRVYRGIGNRPEGAYLDPRHPDMGWRAYGDQEGGDGTDWDKIRVKHCIPESGVELTQNSYILEAGFERLNGVDFKKGCFVGQEVTARMKHKTELRKGLAVVEIAGAAPVGTSITRDDKTIGTLFTQSGARAIAHLRFDRTGDRMKAGDAKVCFRAVSC